MTTLLMYDAVNVSHLPAAAELVMAYVDGRDTAGNYTAARKRFPHARIVRCTVTGDTVDAEVGDVERYDMTPESGAAWATRKVDAGQHPTLYCALSSWPAVRAAVAAAGLKPQQLSYLVAGYDNNPRIPRGAVGHQFATGTFDTTAVRATWPGVLPAPLSPIARAAGRRLLTHLRKRRSPVTDTDATLLWRLEQQAHRVQMIDIDVDRTGPDA